MLEGGIGSRNAMRQFFVLLCYTNEVGMEKGGKYKNMKKIFNKIGQVLQLVLAAPVKLPGKVGNVLKYIALGLGIMETVLEEEKPPSEEGNSPPTSVPEDSAERSLKNES